MGLTVKQDRFCHEYIIDGNGGQAAIRAGYSPKSAHMNACKMLTNPEIQTRIAQLQADRVMRTEIKADRVVHELGLIAFSNIVNLIYFDGDKFKLKNLTELDSDTTAAIKQIRVTKDGTLSIELHNKLGALSELIKIMGMATDLNLAIAAFHRYGINIKQNPEGDWYISKDSL